MKDQNDHIVHVAFTDDELKAVLYALDLAWNAVDDGFAHPRDDNRAVIESVREKLNG